MAYKRKRKNKDEKFKKGAKLRLTPELQEKVCKAIMAGNYNSVAAGYAGITEATFYRWMAKGREGEQPYLDFFEAVKNAEHSAEVVAVANVRKHWEKNWVAAMTWLERKHQKRWGRSREVLTVESDKDPVFILRLTGANKKENDIDVDDESIS
jgi:hypothetical protein